MTDFLLELRSEEIPARMQAKARDDLARLFAAELDKAGIKTGELVTYATPRRLALIARGLPLETASVREETKGPRTSAPPQALEGFLRKTGLAQDQLKDRDGVWFAIVDKPGRKTADVLAEAIPAIVRAFPWPKSMRWGAASASPESLRWVRPLQGIVALLGEEVVAFEIAGIASGSATLGHRFHHPGPITIGSAADYADKLRACHVLVDQDARARVICDGAAKLAADAGLELIADERLVAENAGLTEWPVPLLGRFDEAFLDVPPEVIQLTARVNQKYFVCRERDGTLANAFICTANIDAADGGDRIVEGNRKVLAARLADAKFFYDTDLKVPLDENSEKLGQIVFHEKLGTVADKVDRVAKLARWLVEEGIVTPAKAGVSGNGAGQESRKMPACAGMTKEALADMAERAARLAKADLVTGMVGEFPELQGVMGGYYAAAQGEAPEVAAAIRDHYKPVGQGDEVPTAPVTVAVSLADKLDSLFMMFGAWSRPTGSKDPYALRRAALGIIALIVENGLRLKLLISFEELYKDYALRDRHYQDILGRDDVIDGSRTVTAAPIWWEEIEGIADGKEIDFFVYYTVDFRNPRWREFDLGFQEDSDWPGEKDVPFGTPTEDAGRIYNTFAPFNRNATDLLDFFADRLKVQQREAGVRHDLIDAVFALGGEDDLVRLLARVKALQAFVATEDGANLLAGYKRAANILKKEGWDDAQNPTRHPGLVPGSAEPQGSAPADARMPGQARHDDLSYAPEPAEAALIAALDAAAPAAADAVAAEDFAAAMAALATLRAPIDAFFEHVTVNDADRAKRAARLALLARIRDAVHGVADFSKIEG